MNDSNVTNTSSMSAYENMFDDDGNLKVSFTEDEIKEITVKAYIDRDKQYNTFDKASEQFRQICKLMKCDPYFTAADSRFDAVFRAKNSEEFYKLLTVEELNILGW